jgi:hypothetical protein
MQPGIERERKIDAPSWPKSLVPSASSTIRLVTPCATPVSITISGRVCRATHQAARHSELSASAYQA